MILSMHICFLGVNKAEGKLLDCRLQASLGPPNTLRLDTFYFAWFPATLMAILRLYKVRHTGHALSHRF